MLGRAWLASVSSRALGRSCAETDPGPLDSIGRAEGITLSWAFLDTGFLFADCVRVLVRRFGFPTVSGDPTTELSPTASELAARTAPALGAAAAAAAAAVADGGTASRALLPAVGMDVLSASLAGCASTSGSASGLAG